MNKYNILLNEIKKHKTIIIHRHQKPDGDAYGSQFALQEFININFKNKEVLVSGNDDSLYLKDLFPTYKQVETEKYKNALVIVVDTANKARISGEIDWENISKSIKIDHHPQLDNYANISIVNDKVSSICEIITDFIFNFKQYKINSRIAKNLYIGILADTNRFMFESITSQTLELASKILPLIKLEDFRQINDILFYKNFNEIKLSTMFFRKAKYKDSVASLLVKKDLHKKFNVDYSTASSMVNVLMQPEEIKYACFGTYDNENQFWRISLRSKLKPVNMICNEFGGGGHKQACGIKLKSKKDFTKIIKRLQEISKND